MNSHPSKHAPQTKNSFDLLLEEEEDPDEPEYIPSQDFPTNSRTHLHNILPVNALNDIDAEEETLSSSFYQSLFEKEDTITLIEDTLTPTVNQKRARKENIIDYFGFNAQNEDDSLLPSDQSTKEIKFFIKNSSTGNLELYKAPSNKTPYNHSHTPSLDTPKNNYQIIPDRDLGFRVFCLQRVVSLDLLARMPMEATS